MSGTAEGEPVDSAVAALLKHNDSIAGPPAAPRKRKRKARALSPEDIGQPSATSDHVAKKKKTAETCLSKDMVVEFDAQRAQSDTQLYTRMYNMGREYISPYYFNAAQKLLLDLGPCAADLLWRLVLEGRTPADAPSKEAIPPTIRQFIETWNFDMPNPSPLSHCYNVTHKFSKLVDVLQSCETQDDSFRGLILVEQPIVASMIVEMLGALDDILLHVRPFTIPGLDPSNSPWHQRTALDSFASGTYNLLVCTQCIEHLEIPGVAVVIQFDLSDSPPSRILPHEPTEHQTLIVHMVEGNNTLHKDILDSYKRPTPREHSHLEPQAQSSTQRDQTGFIHDPTTGLRIYPSDAKAVLRRFICSLPQSARRATTTTDIHSETHHTCILGFPGILKSKVKVTRASGEEAREVVAYRACEELFTECLLDYRFFPTTRPSEDPTKADNSAVGKEEPGTSRSANASLTTRCYSKKSALFWSNSLSVLGPHLYSMILCVERFKDEYHAPILVLTRLPLPDLSEFSVFSSGSRAQVHFHRGSAIPVDEEKLAILHGYTLRIFRAVVNKVIDSSMSNMPYFFAPLKADWDCNKAKTGARQVDIGHKIQWEEMKIASLQWCTSLVDEDRPLTDEMVHDAIVQDRFVEFTNRHYVVRARHDLSPLSKAEDGEREAGHANFLEYCKSRRKDFEGLNNENQPLIEVSLVPPAVNALSPTSKPAAAHTKYPAKSTFFDNIVEENHLLAAVSPPTASVEHDYERLEFLGDAFLKYAVSTYLFVTMPSDREGSLHQARQRIISNKALHLGALQAGIPPYIQSKPVVAKIWHPAGYSRTNDGKSTAGGAAVEIKAEDDGDVVSTLQSSASMDVDTDVGRFPTPQDNEESKLRPRHFGGKRKKQQEEQSLQWLGDKTVADVVEAIIGAAFLTKERDAALSITKILRVPLPGVEQWPDFARSEALSAGEDFQRIPSHVCKTVQKIVGYKFQRPLLLAEALVHSSLPGHKSKNYDRLEFLGDAVLDFPMVSNATLATICVSMGLYKHAQHASLDLTNSIAAYMEQVRVLQDREYKLAAGENRQPGQFWLEIEPPKVLSDVVESIIGAIYVDDSYKNNGVQKFFDEHLKPFYDHHIRLQTLSDHPNKTLTEIFHAESCQNHSIVKEMVGTTLRCDVLVHDVVLASGTDTLSNAALRKAAMGALDALANDPSFMTRVCDCRTSRADKGGRKKQQHANNAHGEQDFEMTQKT
ncbi:hypothetical protein PHLCEN_2v10513 [Hermanssonia centrifuga]|uniref:RNase III domain-containing protein n=1 Tax=Hermanssonia centrifuga TaxID=98765 RepID=A0A2R6NMH9_9APHY|nr:hypothetical protein PHLCEN_2v10513 [Hermanssonia centrifuga]